MERTVKHLGLRIGGLYGTDNYDIHQTMEKQSRQ